MAKLAFLGLGQMGGPMAARLLQAGHDLTVWNRSKGKAEALGAKGARVAAHPAEAATGAEAVFTMLTTAEVVDDVLLGPEGVVEELGPSSVIVEMSTIGPAAFRALEEKVENISLVDAPVLGSVPQAEAGELQIYVGADEPTYEKLRPLLESMGTPMLIGSPGSAAAMKLVVNSTLGALMTTLAEALRLADSLGLERAVALERLANSAIGTTARSKRDKILSGHYPPNFKLSLAEKDMRLVRETAEATGTELRVNPAAASWIDEAEAAGLGELDYSAVVAHVLGDTPRA